MIQRIQSVYLLIVGILLIVALCLPLGTFVDSQGVAMGELNVLGTQLTNGQHYATWGLFCILILATVIALLTIFLFRNRMLQIRMTVFNSLLLIGYYIVFAAFWYIIKDNGQADSFRIHWSLGMPLVAIILNYLTFRAIYKDEVLVRAADRLR